jgi:hypothetical protein
MGKPVDGLHDPDTEGNEVVDAPLKVGIDTIASLSRKVAGTVDGLDQVVSYLPAGSGGRV